MRSLRGHYLGPGATARIGIAGGIQALQELRIYVVAPALRVGGIRPDIVEPPFVPLKSKPSEVVLYQARMLNLRPLRAEVLY